MLSGGLFNRSIYCFCKAYTQTMELQVREGMYTLVRCTGMV